jgi:hypothetical protein
VAPSALQSTIRSLVAKYPTFGGVDGWEYFNSMPGGTAAPWQWASAGRKFSAKRRKVSSGYRRIIRSYFI